MPAQLVPEHRRQRVRIEPLDEVQIGVAQAGSDGAHQHLARSGLADLHVLNDERLVHLVQNGGFHGMGPPK